MERANLPVAKATEKALRSRIGAIRIYAYASAPLFASYRLGRGKHGSGIPLAEQRGMNTQAVYRIGFPFGLPWQRAVFGRHLIIHSHHPKGVLAISNRKASPRAISS